MQNREQPAESERRQTTVMFADISGFTSMSEKMDPEEVTAIMNQCFAIMESAIERYGGAIDKFIGDCVMALFGLPTAIENAPGKALNAAIEIRNQFKNFSNEQSLQIPLDVHIGINSGTVIAGAVGGREKREYTVMGDAVNVASRLKDIAEKGQILIGPWTYRGVRSDFKFRELKPIALKGKEKTLPVFELLSEKEKIHRTTSTSERMIQSAMVGRDVQFHTLVDLVTGLDNAKGSIVNIIGEAGIGKSRLMAELKASDTIGQIKLLQGRAISMGRNLSFHPLIDMLKGWAGIEENDGETEAFQKLEAAVKTAHPENLDQAIEIIPFVATLMGMKLAGAYAERVKGIEGEALEKLILKNFRDLTAKISEQKPLIICIEDLHWADTSSIELLSALFHLARSHPILFINVFRPNYEETGDRITQTIRENFKDSYTEILLQPLDEKESDRLIANLLNVRGLPHALREQIVNRAGGNPFFIEEVMRSLIDEGAVEPRAGGFEVTEKINDVVIPSTINEVLMARIDRLDESKRSLIKVASVIGRSFFHKILTSVAGPIDDIDLHLSYLKDIQLLRERTRLQELEFLFKHALAQEAAYESILLQKRKELHLHVAQAIESVFPERLHDFYGMLAFHYIQGESFDKAEEYMRRAGEEAMKSSASSEALNYFTLAMALYKRKHGEKLDPATVAMFEKNIGLALHQKGMNKEAIEYISRALDFYWKKRPKNDISLVIKFIFAFIKLLKYLYFPSRQRAVATNTDNEFIYLYYKYLQGLAVINPRRFFLESIVIFDFLCRYDMPSIKNGAPFFASLSVIFAYAGMMFWIGKKITRVMKEKIQADDVHSQLFYEYGKMFCDYYSGDWPDRSAFRDDLFRFAVDTGELFTAAGYLFYNFYFLLHAGKLIKAKEMAESLKHLSGSFDHHYMKGLSYHSFAKYLIERRDVRQAIPLIEESIDYYVKNQDLVLILMQNSFHTDALVLVNDMEGAAAAIEKAHPYIKANEGFQAGLAIFYRSESNLQLYRLERALSADNKKILKIISDAKESTRNYVKKGLRAADFSTEALHFRGVCHWLTGIAAEKGMLRSGKLLSKTRARRRYKKALRWWKKSIDRGEYLGAKLHLSRAYLEVAKRILTGTAPHSSQSQKARIWAKKIIGLTPEECLEKARAMFEEMDLTWDLEELGKIRVR